MPVPTDTFFNIRKLNVVFALTAIVLAASTFWLIFADHERAWRQTQRDARVWEAAMTVDAQAAAMTAADQQKLAELQQEKERLEAMVADQIQQLEQQLAAEKGEHSKLVLPLARTKGEIGPKQQAIERATLDHGHDSRQVRKLQQELSELQATLVQQEAAINARETRIAQLEERLRKENEQAGAVQRQIDGLTREQKAIEEKLAALQPRGAARLSAKLRDAPLLNWMNPSEQIEQIITKDVRTDLNFLTVDTIDRCNTCHVNIDNPRYEESQFVAFIERQIARAQKQDVDRIEHPVVMLDFWVNAASLAGPGAQAALAQIDAEAMERVNALLAEADSKNRVENAEQLHEQFRQIQTPPSELLAAWYEPLRFYASDLRNLLQAQLGKDEFKHLKGLYRFQLIAAYNQVRAEQGLPAVSDSPALLGHPRMELFVGNETRHPMKIMGCSVCHEGSGQETDFVHVAHTPREMWVDARTGAPVPAALVISGPTKEINAKLREQNKTQTQPEKPLHPSAKPKTAGASLDDALVPGGGLATAKMRAGDEAHGSESAHAAPGIPGIPGAPGLHHPYTHQDVKITDAANPAPFAPRVDPHGDFAGAYRHPSQPDTLRPAVRQSDYWTRKYGWHEVPFHDWEKPMHSLEYVESSCNKCHTQVFDIKEAAPQLYQGRALFAQLGCVNCHSVTDLQDDLDIKKVGPSLVHVKHKLSAPMMASWIWSPKAFRPTARMPHFFMLENNSAPVDILRTRVETAAMTHYLLNAQPSQPSVSPTVMGGTTDVSTDYESTREQPPARAGNVAKGRQVFNSVGCLACHTNLSEHGEKWITQDLLARGAVRSEAQATQQFGAMNYQQQHWYAMEHLQEKLVLVGPELSGVGTKLKAGRQPEEARAWLYDWLRNPRHYSSYTIMPSLRLSEEEANDLTAYLLALERPDYEAENFYLDEKGNPALDKKAQAMLDKLLEALPDPTGKVTAGSKQEEKLFFVGQKALTHYGCQGCHVINGLESAASACANLDEWGLKDPHKLDFGYFDHAYDGARSKPTTVWKIKHEGLTADAPQLSHTDTDKLRQRTIAWEHMDLKRRPWLYHKLHNTRVYDRGRTLLEGSLREDGDEAEIDIGRPYDKIKMPKFFLTDEQVRAIVTYVTSVRKPLVSREIQQATYNPQRLRWARGRQVATLYNCYGCHNIEGNDVHIQEFYGVLNPDGSFNGDYENLNNAPPRLIGQGAKTQPDWLVHFLHNVHPLRPWLTVRMPSFPLTRGDSTALTDYFAAHSQIMAGELESWLQPIDDYIRQNPGRAWWEAEKLRHQAARLKAFALAADLARPRDFDPTDTTAEERAEKWEAIRRDAGFLKRVSQIEYPFPPTPRPQLTQEQWVRGEALFNELRCVQCHAFGDEQMLDKLWALERKDAPPSVPTAAKDEDSYEDYEDTKKPAQTAKAEDDYGDYGEETDEPAAPLATGRVFSAPNLSYAAHRLQYGWFYHWLQEPGVMQPGTKMPQWFPGEQSAFAKYPPEARQAAEAMYGHTGPAQMKYLLEFLYAAGWRNYTPGAEKLYGAEPEKVGLTPLAPPPELPAEPGAAVQPAAPAGGVAVPEEAPAAVAPAPAAREPEPKVSSIELQTEPTATFEGTRIVGEVKVAAKPRPRRPIRMDADPFCAGEHDGPVPHPAVSVNDDLTIRNVLVYVKNPPAGRFAAPAQPAVLDQIGCQYHPHVLAVQAGQKIRILNSDNTMHNVNAQPKNNTGFNLAQNTRGMEDVRTFSKPEMGIAFKCDVHPWMGAFVHVLPHPFFAVTDVQGRFEIKGLPPGTYQLETWHEDGAIATQRVEITVQADTSHRADVTLGSGK